jgi:hypothetical protein
MSPPQNLRYRHRVPITQRFRPILTRAFPTHRRRTLLRPANHRHHNLNNSQRCNRCTQCHRRRRRPRKPARSNGSNKTRCPTTGVRGGKRRRPIQGTSRERRMVTTCSKSGDGIVERLPERFVLEIGRQGVHEKPVRTEVSAVRYFKYSRERIVRQWTPRLLRHLPLMKNSFVWG